MRAAMTIAGKDTRQYFASPKGAALLWFFSLLLGILFWSFMQSFVATQQRAALMGGQAPTLEQLLRVVFANANFLLLLMVPAVTMQSFAEEKRTQSMKLLMSSPVTSSDIVLGKFLASLLFMGLVLITSFVLPLFLSHYGMPDRGIILSSYVGLFLCMMSQLAFGLWVSSMASSQITAFLFTLFGLFMLMILNWIVPDMYLASTPHLESFLKGRLTVADTVYFLCFAGLFLFFTQSAVEAQRRR